MERYITAEDVMANIKIYRKTLSYDDKFDFEMETNRLKLSDKTRAKLNDKLSASQHRTKRYGVTRSKNK